MIELRSDTFTLPTEAMRRAMSTARVGDDVYGEDPTVRHLEERAAEMFGKQAACLMPSGTMANLCAILAQAPRGSRLLVGDESDIYCYEAGGASVCGSVVYAPLPTERDGRIAMENLLAPFADDADDPQFAPPAMVCLENTHNRCGGAVLPLRYMEDVGQFAATHGIAFHLDGARIFNAALALGVPVAEVAASADTVQFCLSKGLSAPVGSIVLGRSDVVCRVRRIRKMLGGGMRQAGVFAAAGLVALDEMVDRLADDHRNAQRLAEGLSQLDGLHVYPASTNIVLFDVLDERFTWQKFVAEAERAGVRLAELGHGRVRAVTHSGVTSADVDRAVELLAHVLRN